MKKAISPLIGWILLIGFSVAMAAFISNWVIQQTKETFQPEKFLEDISCDGVSFSITKICKREPRTCDRQPPGDYTGIKLEGIELINKGAYTIRNITIMPLYGITISDVDNLGDLKPGDPPSHLTPPDVDNICIKLNAKNEIKLIPVIEKEDKVYYCTDNAVILNNEAIETIPQCTT